MRTKYEITKKSKTLHETLQFCEREKKSARVLKMSSSDNSKKNERYLNVDSNRDLMGIVRGKCNRCDACSEYKSNVKLYSKTGQISPSSPHPSNDVAIMNCAKCHCPSNCHEIDTFGNHLERGTDSYHRGDFNTAIKEYSLALNSPNSALRVKAHSNRAAINLRMENFSAALADCNQALRIEPANVKALNRKSHALLHLQKHEDAIKIYKLIVNKLDADNETAKQALKQLNVFEQPKQNGKSKETKASVTQPPESSPPNRVAMKSILKDACTQTTKKNENLEVAKRETKDASTQTHRHAKQNDEEPSDDNIRESVDFFNAFEKERLERQRMENEARSRTWAFNDSDSDGDENERDIDDDVRSDNDTPTYEKCDPESYSWAIRWEEEQNARKNERVRPDVRSKEKNTSDDASANFAKISFEDLIQVSAATISVLGDDDINGDKRGKCLQCKICPQFNRVSTSSSLLSKVSKASYEISLGKLLSSNDGERCANCSCSYEHHEDKQTFNRRIAREKANFERENKELRLKKKKRLEIIQKAKNRMREAKENGIILEKSHLCLLTGMRRKHCNDCMECKQFCTFSNSSFFAVDEEILYCHLCGCSATEHEVDWEAEKEEKSKQERENKKRWEHYERQQKHKDRSRYREEHEDDGLLSILDLSREEFRGNVEVLKKQYRRKALAHHPDKNSSSTGEKFIKLTQAYKKLMSKYSPE
jgi:tetratricopeptide (TPR) repeat protein